MSLSFRIALAFVVAGCTTEPGDVGSTISGGDTSSTASSGDTADPTGDASEGSGDPPGGSSTNPVDPPSSSTADTADDTTLETTSGTGDGDTGEATGSTGDGGTGGMTPAADCSECGPGQSCVLFTAFTVETFCVATPAACAGEVDCACGSTLCNELYDFCVDPPQPDTISCECTAC